MHKEETFCSEDGETLLQVPQRGGKCPISGNVPGQVGQATDQANLVDVPVCCRGIGLEGFKGPFQPKAIL